MRFQTMRLVGHPLHPALVHLPIGAWTMTCLSDCLALWSGEDLWWEMARSSLAVGLIAVVPAAIVGFVDYLALDEEGRVSRVAISHLAAVLSAAVFYLGSFLTRDGLPPGPSSLPVGLALIGFALLIVGGWLGAELVYRYRVGVGAVDPRPDTIDP